MIYCLNSLTILLNSLVTLYRVVNDSIEWLMNSLGWLINLMLLLKFCVLNPTFSLRFKALAT